MELIDRIFYRKINPSDFKKLYDIDKPATGGGQTYLEAAGITDEKMVDFLSIAERIDSPSDPRFTYTIKAYTLGNPGQPAVDLEFAPRNGRANYKISRQTMANKHPAWSPANGFPIPNTDPATGKYTSAGNFVGIIDNLIIMIIRTSYCHYYASFVNSATMPVGWPTGVGLEDMFQGDRRGIVNFANYSVEFIDTNVVPFGTVVKIPRKYKSGFIAPHNEKRNRIVFGAPGTGKSYLLNADKDLLLGSNSDDYERVTFHADYSYSQFVGTYKPISTMSGEIAYKFVPGPFMRILVKAYKNIIDSTDTNGQIDQTKIRPFVLLVEEINRAHTATVFGEVFQLLDRNKDGISEYEIQPSEDIRQYLAEKIGGSAEDYFSIQLPDNMFIWATMNSADQGVFPMDTAFKRRWNFNYIGIDDDEITEDYTGTKVENIKLRFTLNGNVIRWNVLRRAINAKLSSDTDDIRAHEDKLMGPFFVKCNQYTLDTSDVISTATENAEFLSVFCEKVLMYLFEDVARTRRDELFDGIKGKCNRYSEVRVAFMKDGLEIFGKDFKTKYYDTEEKEYDAKKVREGV